MVAAAFNTGWLIYVIGVAALWIFLGAFYLWRGELPVRFRRGLLPLLGLTVIGCVRAFVLKG